MTFRFDLELDLSSWVHKGSSYILLPCVGGSGPKRRSVRGVARYDGVDQSELVFLEVVEARWSYEDVRQWPKLEYGFSFVESFRFFLSNFDRSDVFGSFSRELKFLLEKFLF